jgi:predicted site-specific integrase-resolvase
MPKKIGNLIIYTLYELSEKLDISSRSLRQHIKLGKLKAQKVGGKWHVTDESLKEFFRGE